MDSTQRAAFLREAANIFSGVKQATAMPDQATAPQLYEAWLVRTAAWGRTLADVDYDDARRCLDAIHRGEAGEELRGLWDWFDKFPAVVRRWCRDHATPKPQDRPLKFFEPRPVKCRHCLDRGVVSVLNPAFADEHAHQLEDQGPIDINDKAKVAEVYRWFRDARAWCRSQGVGPLVATVVCGCGARKLPEGHTQIIHNPKTMPALRGFSPLDCYEALAAFEPVEISEAYAWTP